MTVLFLIVLSAISASLQQAIIWVMKNLKKNSFGAREKGKLLKQAQISKTDVDWIAYKCARNEFKKLFEN